MGDRWVQMSPEQYADYKAGISREKAAYDRGFMDAVYFRDCSNGEADDVKLYFEPRYVYSFTANRRASEATVEEQAAKIMEEAEEVSKALHDGESPFIILEEVMDVIVAAEGMLRKFDRSVVFHAYHAELDKGVRRGDWVYRCSQR